MDTSVKVTLLANENGQNPVIVPKRCIQMQHLTVRSKLNLEFLNLSYKVKHGGNEGSKTLLNNVSGQMMAGQLTAIMGPSGAGKSTLLNILSGYKVAGMAGTIFVNKKQRDLTKFRKYSCYIMQENRLHDNLTIQEAMAVAANLKLGSEQSHEKKQLIIREILKALGLAEHRKTMTCKLSGGQRKRMSIALELVNNPPVIFFDEPTSGLDSSTCYQTIRLLKMLANEGRNIIFTIHQPSALICEMFDQLYTLADGHCIYQGSFKQLVPFLKVFNLRCPSFSNPPDFLLEVASGEYGNYNSQLIQYIGNGKKNINGTSNANNNFENSINMNVSRNQVLYSDKGSSISTVTEMKTHSPDEDLETLDYATSQLRQTYLVFKRQFLFISRDFVLMKIRYYCTLLVAILMSVEYYNYGNNGAKVFNNLTLLGFNLCFLGVGTMMLTIMTLPAELQVIMKENFNGWYSLKAFFFAFNLADLPYMVMANILYICIFYHFTDQPHELSRFFMFMLVCILVTAVAQSIGFILGALLQTSFAALLAPALNLALLVISGLYIPPRNMPSHMRWLIYFSYLHYGYEGTSLSVYGFNRDNLPCPQIYCHLRKQSEILGFIDMQGANYWVDVVALIVYIIVCKILGYYALKFKFYRNRYKK